MKKLLLYAFVILSFCGATAQSKLSPSALMMIEQAQLGSRDGADRRINAIVKLAPGADASSIESADVGVLSQRGRLAIVSMPISKAKGVAALPAVSRMAFGAKAQPLMDVARPASRVRQLQFGSSNGFTKNYRGTNTLLGMMDQGLDPNHINFYNKALEANRITYVATISGTEATVREYQTPAEIKGFATDNARSSHATHVAGIMGGSYNKPGDVTVLDDDYSLIHSTTMSNPYFGVAPEAELNLCVGDLYEENICLGAELFAQRAEASGKPAAFNLSVASTVGPHDGTDLACQYLAEVGKNVIVCVAAGNDGTEAVSLTKTFDASSLSVSTVPSADASGNRTGLIDVWSADNKPVTVAFALVNSKTGTVSWSVDIPETGDDNTFLIANSNIKDVSASNRNFDNTFSTASYVIAAATLDTENNRYNVSASMNLIPEGNSDLIPAFIFKGAAGQKMNAYAFGTTFTNGGLANYTAGNADQSINNYACAGNVLAVGSYTSRVYFPTLAGGNDGQAAVYQYGLTPDYIGQVSSFTSYGSLPSGKTLPEFCAPGQVIISSISKYAIDGGAEKANTMSANAPNTTVNVRTGSRNNYWGYMQGTSMAAPYVTGTVGLLLEADPTLTVDKVRSLITETANKPASTFVGVAAQWGAGKLNAEDAMRKLLGKPSAIGDVTADTDRRCAVNVLPGSVEAIVAGESGVKASLYSIAGMFAGKAEGTGDSVSLSTFGLSRGVYVLTVETSSGVRVSRRVLIE